MANFYTRTGDDGTTGLLGEGRVRKDSPRLEAIGNLDETSDEVSSVLLCGAHFGEAGGSAISHVELPSWITEGSAYLTGEGDVVFHFDLGPGNG